MTPLMPSSRSKLSIRPLVKISFSVESYSSPKKAKGAISAPTLVPVTISKRGRLPLSDQPLKNPAP